MNAPLVVFVLALIGLDLFGALLEFLCTQFVAVLVTTVLYV